MLRLSREPVRLPPTLDTELAHRGRRSTRLQLARVEPVRRDALSMQVVRFAIGDRQRARQLPPEQGARLGAQQLGGAAVGLDDAAILPLGQVADRHRVVELGVATALGLERTLCPPQLLVLHGELELVELELLDHPEHIAARHRGDVVRRLVSRSGRTRPRPLSQRISTAIQRFDCP